MSYLQPPKKLLNYGLGVPPETVKVCPMCNKNNARIFFNAHPLIKTNQVFPCEECDKPVEHTDTKYYEKNPTSLWKDPHGREVAIDQRGNQMKENPYKRKVYDRHGWSQTYKKTFKKTLQKNGML